jgi:tetratricopeptide (TPR) repeat protein
MAVAKRRFSRIAIGLAVLALGSLAVLGHRAGRALDADTWLERGEAALGRHDFAAAERAYRRAAQLRSDDSRGEEGVVRALQGRGAMKPALAASESVLVEARREDWPVNALAVQLRNVGLLRYQNGDLAGADAAFVEIRTLDASWLEPDLLLCSTRLRRGDAASVRQLLPALHERYGDLEPFWRVAMVSDAVAAGARPSAFAIEVFTNLRALPSDDATAQAALGSGLANDPVARAVSAEGAFAHGDLATAQATWRALCGGPLDGVARIGLGRLALQNDAAAAALASFDLAAADPRAPRELCGFWRGQSLQMLGQLDAARAVLVPAVAANPLGLRCETLLGVVEAERGDRAAAETAYTRVLAVEPKHAEALMRCGKLYIGSGRRDAGVQLLQRYLAAHPDGRWAQEARDLLSS